MVARLNALRLKARIHKAGVDTTAPTITSSANVSNVENVVLAHTLTANESVAWSIVGGADQARFELSGTTLRWASNGTKDYETPNDANIDNAYVVQVRATDTSNNTTNQTITVTVTDADEVAPTITSSASVNNAENSVLVHMLTANESVTWSIVGGADQARFEISGTTLRWASNGTKDFETPNDADTDNAYIVQVRAIDLSSNTTNQTITVIVTNVAEGAEPEAPVLTLISSYNDNTPNFTLEGDLQIGDTVRLQYDTHSDFSVPTAATNTISSGEDTANELAFSTGTFANGTWYFRVRIERPVDGNSAWSNIETETIA